MKEERLNMMRERQKILEQEMQRQRDFMDLQYQMNRN